MEKRFNTMDGIASVLTIIGAVNWGLVGLFNFDLVETIFGSKSFVSRAIYTIVGLAGLYLIYTTYKMFNEDNR